MSNAVNANLTTIKLEGLEGVYDRINKLPQQLVPKLEAEVLVKSLDAMGVRARSNAPKETGKLAKSIRITVRRRGDTLVGSLYFSKPHAHLIEYGHWQVVGGKLERVRKTNRRWNRPAVKATGKRVRFIPAQPFLRPAFDAEAEKAVETAVTEFKKLVENL